ncbi:hypothetical protein IV498_04645 [Paenarthrobacter sp. Z7-10]|uniref:hypothetical protein n=1 Tax=Paenarthrobacter sp. Z7-10 TaxID=2787635 RepID=UPI0022A94964|nr:hypothetical protein [Paenarthrobacter sp. Z7-10]MCZ2402486.1 hypothetical protein [Paenarthrobacter sp. Z7-10]
MQALWIVLVIVVAAVAGWPVTAGVLRLARTADVHGAAEAGPEEHSADDHGPDVRGTQASSTVSEAASETAAQDPPVEVTDAGVLRGGMVIGILERLAVVVAILADQPVAIAYIVAIKGLGRYPELKQTPAASERFIIGTLSSMLWAAGVAIPVRWLLLG